MQPIKVKAERLSYTGRFTYLTLDTENMTMHKFARPILTPSCNLVNASLGVDIFIPMPSSESTRPRVLRYIRKKEMSVLQKHCTIMS